MPRTLIRFLLVLLLAAPAHAGGPVEIPIQIGGQTYYLDDSANTASPGEVFPLTNLEGTQVGTVTMRPDGSWTYELMGGATGALNGRFAEASAGSAPARTETVQSGAGTLSEILATGGPNRNDRLAEWLSENLHAYGLPAGISGGGDAKAAIKAWIEAHPADAERFFNRLATADPAEAGSTAAALLAAAQPHSSGGAFSSPDSVGNFLSSASGAEIPTLDGEMQGETEYDFEDVRDEKVREELRAKAEANREALVDGAPEVAAYAERFFAFLAKPDYEFVEAESLALEDFAVRSKGLLKTWIVQNRTGSTYLDYYLVMESSSGASYFPDLLANLIKTEFQQRVWEGAKLRMAHGGGGAADNALGATLADQLGTFFTAAARLARRNLTSMSLDDARDTIDERGEPRDNPPTVPGDITAPSLPVGSGMLGGATIGELYGRYGESHVVEINKRRLAVNVFVRNVGGVNKPVINVTDITAGQLAADNGVPFGTDIDLGANGEFTLRGRKYYVTQAGGNISLAPRTGRGFFRPDGPDAEKQVSLSVSTLAHQRARKIASACSRYTVQVGPEKLCRYTQGGTTLSETFYSRDDIHRLLANPLAELESQARVVDVYKTNADGSRAYAGDAMPIPRTEYMLVRSAIGGYYTRKMTDEEKAAEVARLVEEALRREREAAAGDPPPGQTDPGQLPPPSEGGDPSRGTDAGPTAPATGALHACNEGFANERQLTGLENGQVRDSAGNTWKFLSVPLQDNQRGVGMCFRGGVLVLSQTRVPDAIRVEGEHLVLEARNGRNTNETWFKTADLEAMSGDLLMARTVRWMDTIRKTDRRQDVINAKAFLTKDDGAERIAAMMGLLRNTNSWAGTDRFNSQVTTTLTAFFNEKKGSLPASYEDVNTDTQMAGVSIVAGLSNSQLENPTEQQRERPGFVLPEGFSYENPNDKTYLWTPWGERFTR